MIYYSIFYYLNQLAANQRSLANLDRQIATLKAEIKMIEDRYALGRIKSLNERIDKLAESRSAIVDNIAALQVIISNMSKGLPPNTPNPDGNTSTTNPGFAGTIFELHKNLMSYFKTNVGGIGTTAGSDNHIIPYVPRNFNLRVSATSPGSSHNGNADYSRCIVPTLGNDSQGYQLFYIELYGYFTTGNNPILTNQTSVSDIINNGKYVLKSIRLPPVSIGGSPTVVQINGNTNLLSSYVSNPSAVTNVVNLLTKWAKDTAFLTPLYLCNDTYWSTYGDGVQPTSDCVGCNSGIVYSGSRGNLSVPQVATVSSKSSNISLPNSLQKEYYDRLYDFIDIKKLSSASAYNLLTKYQL